VGNTEHVLALRGLGAQVQGGGVIQLGGASSLCLFRWGRVVGWGGGEDDEDVAPYVWWRGKLEKQARLVVLIMFILYKHKLSSLLVAC
jgi:hypothetical protein